MFRRGISQTVGASRCLASNCVRWFFHSKLAGFRLQQARQKAVSPPCRDGLCGLCWRRLKLSVLSAWYAPAALETQHCNRHSSSQSVARHTRPPHTFRRARSVLCWIGVIRPTRNTLAARPFVKHAAGNVVEVVVFSDDGWHPRRRVVSTLRTHHR